MSLSKQQIGARMNNARVARGFSRRAIAQYVDVTEQTLIRWERGERRPDDDKLELILKALVVGEACFHAADNVWMAYARHLTKLSMVGQQMEMPTQFPAETNVTTEVFREKDEPQAVAEPVDKRPKLAALTPEEQATRAYWKRHFARLDEAFQEDLDSDI